MLAKLLGESKKELVQAFLLLLYARLNFSIIIYIVEKKLNKIKIWMFEKIWKKIFKNKLFFKASKYLGKSHLKIVSFFIALSWSSKFFLYFAFLIPERFHWSSLCSLLGSQTSSSRYTRKKVTTCVKKRKYISKKIKIQKLIIWTHALVNLSKGHLIPKAY